MQEKNVNFVSLGCRLNTLEAEKIRKMLAAAGAGRAVVINTCSVTAEAERQSKQAIRRIIRENPDTLMFVTGCAATRDPDGFRAIKGVTRVIVNKDKMDIAAYGIEGIGHKAYGINDFSVLSKGFVQIQTGCNHACAYCIVSKLRGKNVSFPYEQILGDARALTDNGYNEIVLTGVDIAGWRRPSFELEVLSFEFNEDENNSKLKTQHSTLADLCKSLLCDLPNLKRLRLSSLDPGVDLRPIADLMRQDLRMLPHMHLSMQSGADAVLASMGRRHNAEMVRRLVGAHTCAPGREYAPLQPITFSWDMIFGFPGEGEKEFAETCALIRELKPIRLHAFPFSPRPGTAAATMPNQVPRVESKRRVKIATDMARENMYGFMESQIGKTVQVLVENGNMARDAHDIPVKINGRALPARSIADVRLTGIADRKELMFVGEVTKGARRTRPYEPIP